MRERTFYLNRLHAGRHGPTGVLPRVRASARPVASGSRQIQSPQNAATEICPVFFGNNQGEAVGFPSVTRWRRDGRVPNFLPEIGFTVRGRKQAAAAIGPAE